MPRDHRDSFSHPVAPRAGGPLRDGRMVDPAAAFMLRRITKDCGVKRTAELKELWVKEPRVDSAPAPVARCVSLVMRFDKTIQKTAPALPSIAMTATGVFPQIF